MRQERICSASVRDAVSGPQPVSQSTYYYHGLLREDLRKRDNYTPKEVRRKLLENIAEYDNGSTPYPDTAAFVPLQNHVGHGS